MSTPRKSRYSLLVVGLGLPLIFTILVVAAFALGMFDDYKSSDESARTATSIAGTNRAVQSCFCETATPIKDPTLARELTLTPMYIRATKTTEVEMTQFFNTVLAQTRESIMIKPSEVPTTSHLTPNIPQAKSTIVYPGGQLITLIYNQISFYMLNKTGSQLLISEFSFESLDAQGQPVLNIGTDNYIRVDGETWGQFYAYIDNNNCASAEISQSSGYLRPSDCHQYYPAINPSENDSQGFWRTRTEPIVEFRVFFNNEEVACCPLAVNATELRCEMRIP